MIVPTIRLKWSPWREEVNIKMKETIHILNLSIMKVYSTKNSIKLKKYWKIKARSDG